MSFGNRQQTKTNTTTIVSKMYNPTGDDAGVLTLGFWNQYVSVKINPALPRAEQVDNKVYNYDKGLSLVLNSDNILLVNRGIREMMAQKKAKIDIIPIAVRAGGSVLKIGNKGEYDGINDWYIAIIEIDDKMVAKSSLFFPFKKQSDNILYYNYNEEAGTADKKVISISFEMFRNFLKLAQDTLVTGGAHGATHLTNISLSKLNTKIDTIKGMIEVGTFGGGGSGGRNNQGGGTPSGGVNFASRRRRSNGESEETNTNNSAPSGRRGGKKREESIEDISEIENEMMDDINDVD